MNIQKNISFDFDHCLPDLNVRGVAKQLIKGGQHNIFITTARWPDPMTQLWEPGANNDDLYYVMDEIGLERTKVIFTSTHTKADCLQKIKVDIHLDDNKDQLFWARLAGIKCVDVTAPDWLKTFEEMLAEPKYNIKLLVCGDGRHGKDTVADLLNEMCGLTTTSSSRVVAGLIFDAYKEEFGYKTVDECYEDRINKRTLWYNFITDFNSPDRTKLTKMILKTSNIYVGLRNPEEFHQAKTLFDATIFVDASGRLEPESRESTGITKDMCDLVIENNGTLEELRGKVKALSRILRLSNESVKEYQN